MKKPLPAPVVPGCLARHYGGFLRDLPRLSQIGHKAAIFAPLIGFLARQCDEADDFRGTSGIGPNAPAAT
jgi:hypothetical protein